MDVALDFVAYVGSSMASSSAYRQGFASAVFIGIVAQVIFRLVQGTWKRLRDVFAPAKVAVTKDGPSAFDVVSRSFASAMKLAMVVAIWAILF